MLLIGVVGKSGAGKTTFSKYIEEKYSIIRIDGDEIVRRNGLIQERNAIIEDLTNGQISQEEIKQKQKEYRKKLDHYISLEVQRTAKKSIKIAVVDYVLLYELPQLWDKMDYKILIIKDAKKIAHDLIKRCGKEKAQKLKPVNKMIESSTEKLKVDYKITNNDNIEDFYKQIDITIEDILNKVKD